VVGGIKRPPLTCGPATVSVTTASLIGCENSGERSGGQKENPMNQNKLRARRAHREQFDPTDDGVSFIQLNQGLIAIVDTEDYARLSHDFVFELQ
jgi:hypothetical protein